MYHRLFRETLVTALNRDPVINVVGETAEGQEALAFTLERRPDLVLIDLDFPHLSAIHTARLILSQRPGTRIFVLGQAACDHRIQTAFESGVSGAFLTTIEQREFLDLVKRAARRERIASSSVLLLPRVTQSAVKPLSLNKLTRRENEIVDRITLGLNNKEIAGQLLISIDTVKVHANHIFRKLGVRDRVDLISRYFRARL